ncbi:DUF1259 domain-containing protein [Nocardia salmonicida]|uniref:DUF1259 domain-containing protein n=1 Tax=Nocardia salmonicida TaxID=53431 RepID=UPI003628E2F1
MDTALGRRRAADGGLFKYNLARADTISDNWHVLPPIFGVTTVINFQPTPPPSMTRVGFNAHHKPIDAWLLALCT